MAVYSYSIDREVFFSNRVNLFGGRLYADKTSAFKAIEGCDARVCPVASRVSYLKQEVRLFWGALLIFLIGLPVSTWVMICLV